VHVCAQPRLKATRDLYPFKSAALAESLPPRCISGRWLSVSIYERNVLQAGHSPAEQCATWTNILSRALPRKQGRKPTAPSELQLVDEPRIEEMKAFSDKMGRWAKEVMVGVSDLFFWHVVNCMHESRAPLDHLVRFLDKDRRLPDGGFADGSLVICLEIGHFGGLGGPWGF
jgi:hypothetical protein